jgi:predicted secreted protein
LPPPPPTDITASQPSDNTLLVSFTRPNIIDYLGCSLYINGTWKKWLSNTANSDVFSVDVTSYAREVETTYQLVVEDTYSDFGYSPTQSITLTAPSTPPSDPPPPDPPPGDPPPDPPPTDPPPDPPPDSPPPTETDVISMPTVSMGTTLKKGTDVIAQLTSIDGLNLKSDTVESTALDTIGGYKTFVSTLKDAGEVALNGFFDYATHGTLLDDFEGMTVQTYTIEFPDKLTTTGTTWTFSAVLTDYHTSVDLGALIKFEATLKVSGKPTLAGPV